MSKKYLLILLIIVLFLIKILILNFNNNIKIERFINYDNIEIIYFRTNNIVTTKITNVNYSGNNLSLKNNNKILIQDYNTNINIKNKNIILDFTCGFGRKNLPTLEEINKIIPKLNKTKNNIIILHDLHTKRSFNNKNIPNTIDFIKKYNFKILCYGHLHNTEEHKIFLDNNIPFQNIPHHINNNIFKFYNVPKKYDIIIYGDCNKNNYPFRYRLKNLLNNNFNIFYTGNLLSNQGLEPKILAKKINQSYMSVITPSKFNYFLQKYLEIPLCNSCPLGNLPKTNSEKIINLYKNDYVKVTPEMSDSQIINIVKDNLKNKKNLKNKINNLNQRINKYTCNNYSTSLINIINNF